MKSFCEDVMFLRAAAGRHVARLMRFHGWACWKAMCFALFFLGGPRAALGQAWTQIPQSGAVTSVAVAPDGSLVGVGTDTLLYTRATLNSNWVKVPDSGAVIAVTFLPDGSLLGVGTDKQLYTRATLASVWKLVPGSGSVIGVSHMPDGTVVGIGTDRFLWTRATLNSEWKQVPRSGAVIGIAVLPDGAILGVGTDKALWTRASLTGDWVQIPNSGSVISAAVLSDGRVLGVGTDNALWTRAKVGGAPGAGPGVTSAGSPPSIASGDSSPPAPWVARSFTGNYLPLAGQAEVWSNPKPFRSTAGDMTVQSRFMGQKGTTCRFEVQFNNVSAKALDRGVVLSRPGKAAVSQYDTVLRARLAPGASVAYGTEVRECPPTWGETKDMTNCAECEPTVYFVAQ